MTPGREIFKRSLINRLDDILRTQNRTASLKIDFDTSLDCCIVITLDLLFSAKSHMILHNIVFYNANFRKSILKRLLFLEEHVQGGS